MAKQITNIVFQESIKHYYDVLKNGYLSEIESASDKEYARQHFQNVLFIDNEYIPNQTILFDGLKLAYEHFFKLNSETAFDKTFELLSEYQNISTKSKNEAIAFLGGDKNTSIPDHYLHYINSNLFTIEQLIQSEEMILKSSFENLVAALALYIAGQQLSKKFKIDAIDESQKGVKTTYGQTFTQKQQVLALYFLMKAYGINSKLDSDMTTLSALYHLILGVSFISFDKLKNTNIYKNIRTSPNIFTSDSAYLKNLKIIRPFFENTSLIKVVELIDIQMNRCETK